MAEGRTQAWPVAFESGGETKGERSSGTGLCLFGYPLVASTNSAASIHLPVPVITDPQLALGLTGIFASNFFPGARRCAWRKGMRATPPRRRLLLVAQQFRLRTPTRITGCAEWLFQRFSKPGPSR